ncbi:hypothetical protein CH304_10470 [Rhodococcus sp. 15-649-1-2]|nr:YhgE/Pip domain-containing protein [Rhodococcus sp. 15-649-1-2]OZE83020.1 hypothetical protein CH304_10470 [Rhodococcus sp. 15-649-1-2]
MLAGLSFGTDIKRYGRGTLPRVALLTIVVLPLLYGAMYLWAFWNPFAAVDKVPAALVNSDRGAVVSGEELDAGQQVASALMDSGELDLTLVSEEEAAQGVSDGDYYFSITLPENFSAAVGSPTGSDPQKAELAFAFNDANNYLATVIGQNAAQQVLNQVGSTIGEQAVDKVLVGLTDAGAGLSKAADGAEQLSDGLVTADAGAARLAEGSKTLADNMVTAQDGSAQLAAGASELSTGITTATDPLLAIIGEVGQIGVDPAQLGAGATQLSTGIDAVVSRLGEVGAVQSQAAVAVEQAVTMLRANPDPLSGQVASALTPVLDTLRTQGIDPGTTAELNRLSSDAQQLSYQLDDPSSPLRTGFTLLQDGGLQSDVLRLRDGAQQLATGSATLADGLVQLTDGSNKLASGAGELADGTTRLDAGAKELSTALRDGVSQVPSWTENQRTSVAQTLSAPVALSLEYENRAATFGTGFAPFFLPLALFIGALIIWMLLTPLQSRAVAAGLGSIRVVLASYWPALVVAVCQVLVMYTVVHFGVGLHARYVAGTIAFLVLASAAFLALIQAFNSVFGVAVGRVVTLAFLMLQLVSAGGIYPVETTAKPFQILHPFDPMTYAVNGLRQLTVGGIDSRLWTAIAVLSGVLVASLAASSLAARRNRQYTMQRLYPPIEV